jgi:uncharacterized protein
LARIKYDLLLVTIVATFAVQGPASAASFDCARAATPREQLICRDPVLSDLDRQLGQTYQQRRALLSAHGAELLQRSQLGWLRFITLVCPIAVSADAGGRGGPKNCLQRQYRERLTQLAQVGRRIGPFLFNRLDLYAAKPAPDNSGTVAGFYIQHTAYPQIDNSDVTATASWNKQTVKSLSQSDCDGDRGDDDIDYQIGYASERVISVQWTTSIYCHEAAHGIFSIEAQDIVLLPDPHPLTEKDLFGTDGRWVGKLQQLFWDALRAKGWSPPENQVESVKAQIADAVIRPDHWLFTVEGLQVSFSAYEGGCYVCNPGPVTVPWTGLKPLLSSNAVLP